LAEVRPLVVDFVGTLEAESRGNPTALQVSFIGTGSEIPVMVGVVDAELRSCGGWYLFW
tara:strand:+ start:1053 stop:1229 length:177 start_codon:yes stop_codon:yes gene_type:complete